MESTETVETTEEPDTQRETGKPVETPSLYKNVLLPFLNRLSYVQFVSGEPIFTGHPAVSPIRRIGNVVKFVEEFSTSRSTASAFYE